MRILLFVFFIAHSFAAQAQNLFDVHSHQVKYTVVENPVSHFKHYVATYVPASLPPEQVSGAPVVFFLHGGSSLHVSLPTTVVVDGEYHCVGDPHCSKEYGKEQANVYLNLGLKNFAESRKVILVLPGSNIGWNGDSIPLLESLEQKTVTELESNTKKFYLAGHSMGAMGAIRLSGSLRNHFNAYIALSGTLNRNQMTEEYSRTLLGLRLYIVNEEEAIYPSFLTDSAVLKQYLDDLATKYSVPNLTKIMVAHGDHNTVLNELPAIYDIASAQKEDALDFSEAIRTAEVKGNKILSPVVVSKWTGNVTCGKLIGTHKAKWDVFHSSKYMYVDIQAEKEGLFNSSEGVVDQTYAPRQASFAMCTFDDSSNYEYVKSTPRLLQELTRDSGPYVCAYSKFGETDQLRRVVFSAGASLEEALKKLSTGK